MSNPVVQYTDAGLAELISAKNNGIKGEVAFIAAGDRGYEPGSKQTRLVNERQRVPVSSCEDLDGGRSIRIAALFDGDLEYEVREIGFYLASGTLLGVYSRPDKLLTYKSSSSSWLQRFTLDLRPLPSDSVRIVVGADDVNLLVGDELAKMAAAQIGNMSRHLALLFRVSELEKRV